MAKSVMDQLLARQAALKLKSTEVAKRLGVSKHTYTNWKTRGVPPAKHRICAEFIGISVDEMLGARTPVGVRDSTVAYGVEVSRDGLMFAHEWEKLPEELRGMVFTLVDSMVGWLKREERSGKFGKTGKPRSPHLRPDA